MANGIFDIETPEDIRARQRAQFGAIEPLGTTVGQQAGSVLGGVLGTALGQALGGGREELAQAEQRQATIEEATGGVDVTTPGGLRTVARRLQDVGETDLALQAIDRAGSLEKLQQETALGAQQLELGTVKVAEAEALAPFVTKKAAAQIRQADLTAQKTEREIQELDQKIEAGGLTATEQAKLRTEREKLVQKQEKEQFDREDKQRTEYTKNIAPVQETVDNAESVINLMTGDLAELPQAQIAAIFKFMKGLDPRSVVREAEFDSVANAVSLIDRLFTATGKVKEGVVLGPKAREQLVTVMTELRDAASRKARDIDDGHVALAERRGLNIESIRPARVQQEIARAEAEPAQGEVVGQPTEQPTISESTRTRAASFGITFE